MANQIPEGIAYTDVALLAPLMVATAKNHQTVLDNYLTPALGTNWLSALQAQAALLEDALNTLAREELETRALSMEVEGVLNKLPAWRRHILTLAELAYAQHPKRAKFMRDLGRGKHLASNSISSVRSYLQEVVPEVRAHRAALLAAGGEATAIDRGASWAEQLNHLKIKVARERAEDTEAATAAMGARDVLVNALRTVIVAANAAEWHHPETERAIATALEEGYRKIRKRTASPPDGEAAPAADAPPAPAGAGEPDEAMPAEADAG